ncbi:1-phosphatidylinositol-3-phosphate 5-kinase, partial [Tulasnella sp. 408]
MLRQMLVKEQIPDQDEWEETLLEIGLKVATHVESSSCGFATDAGRDVKIKKLPGGTPRDSEYVDGAVITKNLAHHQMPQDIRQPRIMLVSFPFDDNSLERHRRSIDPPSLQEEEYLKNLTARVAARRPDVLLVEGPVSRETMEYLLERKIAVAGPVKPKATQFVSRVTECEVVSLGQLTVEPKLGYCSRFQLQTIEHTLIPEGRKTFMRFEGCSKETGCTIILRGGDMGTLKKVKNIASCVVLIARNLKMETYLWKDQALMLPPLTAEAAPDPFRPRVLSSSSMYTPSALRPPHNRRSSHTHKSVTFGTSIRSRRSRFSFHSIPSNTLDEDCDEESLDEDARQRRLSHKIQAAINPYLSTFVSASATLRFPPPYPIRRMKELDDSLGRAKKEWQEAEAVMLEEESQRQKADLEATATSALDITLIAPESNDITPPMNIGLPSKDPSASPGNGPEGLPPTGGAYALLKSAGEAPEHDDKPMAAITPMSIFPRSTSGSFFDPYRSVTSETSLIISVLSSHQASENRYLLPPELLDLKEVSCIAQASQLAALRFEQGEMQWLWEWYLRKNKDDLIVKHYQKIAILTSTVPAVELDL